MTANTLTITLFLLGLALPTALEAIKMTGRTRWVLAGVATMFVGAGVFWLPISNAFPKAAGFIGSIAATPVSWFLILFAVAAMLREWWSRRFAQAPIRKPDFDSARGQLLDQVARVEAVAKDLEGKFDDLRGDQVTANTQIKALREQQIDLLMRFRALGDREVMQRHKLEIARFDSKLYFPEGEGIAAVDWDRWEQDERQWRSLLKLWSQIAHSYAQNPPFEVIKAINPEQYYGTWQFSESDVPNSDTVHRYKTFCIMRRHFEDIDIEVENALFRAAYG